MGDREEQRSGALGLGGVGYAWSEKVVESYFGIVSDIGGELLVLAQLL